MEQVEESAPHGDDSRGSSACSTGPIGLAAEKEVRKGSPQSDAICATTGSGFPFRDCPCDALTYARTFGLDSRAEANRRLYAARKMGLADFVLGGPSASRPLWFATARAGGSWSPPTPSGARPRQDASRYHAFAATASMLAPKGADVPRPKHIFGGVRVGEASNPGPADPFLILPGPHTDVVGCPSFVRSPFHLPFQDRALAWLCYRFSQRAGAWSTLFFKEDMFDSYAVSFPTLRTHDHNPHFMRFCYKCERQSFDLLAEPVDGYFSHVRVPLTCCMCDPYGTHVSQVRDVFISVDLSCEIAAAGALKVANPKKNLHLTMCGSIAGPKADEMTAEHRALLQWLPIIHGLQSTSRAYALRTWLRHSLDCSIRAGCLAVTVLSVRALGWSVASQLCHTAYWLFTVPYARAALRRHAPSAAFLPFDVMARYLGHVEADDDEVRVLRPHHLYGDGPAHGASLAMRYVRDEWESGPVPALPSGWQCVRYAFAVGALVAFNAFGSWLRAHLCHPSFRFAHGMNSDGDHENECMLATPWRRHVPPPHAETCDIAGPPNTNTPPLATGPPDAPPADAADDIPAGPDAEHPADAAEPADLGNLEEGAAPPEEPAEPPGEVRPDEDPGAGAEVPPPDTGAGVGPLGDEPGPDDEGVVPDAEPDGAPEGVPPGGGAPLDGAASPPPTLSGTAAMETFLAAAQEARVEANDGMIAARVLLPTPEQRAAAYADLGRPEPPPRVPLDAEPMPGVFVKGMQVGFSPLEPIGRRIGPLVGEGVIWEHRHQDTAVASAAARMRRVHEFNPDNELRARMVKWDNAAKTHVFTRSRVADAMRNLPELELLGNAKLNPEKLEESLVQLLTDNNVPVPKANVKVEVTAKPAKPARVVVDCNLLGTVCDLLVVKVFEYIWDAHDSDGNAKHRRREDVLDDMSEAFGTPFNMHGRVEPQLIVEIDHGAYEYHQTSACDPAGEPEGFLFDETELLMHIARHMDRVRDQCAGLWWTNIQPEKCGKRTTICFARPAGDGVLSRERFMAVWNYAFRKSGKRITSSGNRWNGKKAMFCAFTKDGHRYLMDGHDDRYHTREMCEKPPPSTRAHVYRGLDDRPIYIRPCAEGDDLAAAASRRVASSSYDELVRKNFQMLGFDIKLFFRIGTERHPDMCEFIGTHTLVVNGYTLKGFWTPDIARNLVKLGPTVTQASDWALAALATHASRARMFAGRMDAMAILSARVGLGWAAQLGDLEADFTVKDGIAEQLGMAPNTTVSGKFLTEIIEGTFYDVRDGPPLTIQQQYRLFRATVGHCTYPEFCRWTGSVTGVTSQTRGDEVLRLLPKVLSRKVLDTYSGAVV